ncbi:methyl-accepting chemotaxis protein [Evansella caseinilytica]|uniref:Methyl-accepting chemotaxis protein n=1 Tax=Evansella caseinilytica TaxID=1503961 RepID=A0A1H3Q9K3_9BACI|nr:methyl-accepting chemotaxis protein [Evansella caseinilytica]SDZ09831.1 methyl-accepting chemotaxis protein [Evansella caseinilytica]
MKQSPAFFQNIFKNSINSQFIIYFLLVGLIPMAAAAYLVYFLSSNEIVAKEQELMANQTISTVSGMEQWLDKRLDEIKIVANSEAIQSGSLESQLQLMNVVKNQDASYETVVFTGPDGIVQAHTNEEHIGVLDLSDRAYFQAGMAGEDTISSVLISNATGNRIVVVATPIVSTSGEKLGVMSASINFEQLVELYLNEEHFSQNGLQLVFIDDQNIIQAHPDEELIGVAVEESGISDNVVAIFDKGKQEAGTSNISVDGNELVASYAPIEKAGYGIYLFSPMSSILVVANAIRNYTLIIMAAAAIIITLFAIFFARSMSRPIRLISNHVNHIADGDLTNEDLQIKKNDEIGMLAKNVNIMAKNLKAVIYQVGDNGEKVAASSEQLSASSEEVSRSSEQITVSIQQVANGAEKQSKGVNESTHSLGEVSRGVHQIAETSSQITEAVSATIEKAEEGGESVENNVQKMNKIHDSVTDSVQITQILVERSKEINSILEVITSIAEQTNLLALNAAIEAARAGEHGKGFAVVADEVRKLAESSQQSSQQISDIVVEIQKEMDRTSTAMNGVMAEVKDGLVIANDTKNHFQEIISSTNLVAEQITTMAATTEEISAEVEQVSSSFNEISSVTDTTTENAQEVAAASEEQLATMEEITASAQHLSQMAMELKEVISKFKV